MLVPLLYISAVGALAYGAYVWVRRRRQLAAERRANVLAMIEQICGAFC